MAGPFRNITGQQFGKLTAVRFLFRERSQTFWECVCECGNLSRVCLNNLHSGAIKSCGCGQFSGGRKRVNDLSGHTFGRLTVIGINEEESNPIRLKWRCKCLCGKETSKRSSDLRMGRSRSCGCIRGDRSDPNLTARQRERRRMSSLKRVQAQAERTPKWADSDMLRSVYKGCPSGYQVDHIIPLQGRLVSGLHVADNLQYLTKSQNSTKRNKFIPQIITANADV